MGVDEKSNRQRDWEDARCRSLNHLELVQSQLDDQFQDIAEFAAEITDSPIALISLVERDRQWFKAVVGLNVRETPRCQSFCAHAILRSESVFVVPDATLDERFSNNPLVTGSPNIRFYAGVVIYSPVDSYPIGTLCVIDRKTRELTDKQIRQLNRLARQIENLIALHHNIAVESKSDAQLRQNQIAVDHASDTIFWIGECGNLSFVNQNARENLGYSIDEITTLNIRDIWCGLTVARWREIWTETKTNNSTVVQTTLKSKDGTENYFEITNNFFEIEGEETLLFCAQNITQKVIMQSAFESATEELRQIVDSLPVAIVYANTRRQIVKVNPAFEMLFGYKEQDVVGQSTAMLYSSSRDFHQQGAARFNVDAEASVDGYEVWYRRKDGSEFCSNTVGTKITDVDGNVLAFLGAIRDVTIQKEAEAAIRNKVEQRDQFLAILSHELRNPNAAITNAVGILRHPKVDESKREFAIDIIHRQSQQVSKLLGDLLQVSRITNNKFSLDLSDVDMVSTAKQVTECVEEELRAKHQNLTLQFPSDPVIATVDPVRMIQAQTNLLVNAIKYTPDNGNIVYAIRAEVDQIVIEVSDDGQGIEKALIDQIFDVFVQADRSLDRAKGGMGLGLPLVKMIAEAHGGNVRAFSDGPGLGSQFQLILPHVVDKKSDSPRSLVVSQELNRSKNKVLFVDDNESVRQSFGVVLELYGIDLCIAENGTKALELFHEFRPNICVLDIGLPDLDGFELATRIKSSAYPPSLLIALTGYGQGDDKRKVQAVGFDVHLIKPIEPSVLIHVITEHIESASNDG